MQRFATVLAAVSSSAFIVYLVSTRRIDRDRVGLGLHDFDTKHREGTPDQERDRDLTESPQAITNSERQGAEGTLLPQLLAPEYVITGLDTNACTRGSEPILDAFTCRAAADTLNFVFVSAGSWPSDPHGCHQHWTHPELRLVYFNKHSGSANPAYKVICRDAPEYFVSSLNTDLCPPRYQPIRDSASCSAAAKSLGLSYRMADSWEGDPHGCHKEAANSGNGHMVWYNTDPGRANPKYSVICMRASSYLPLYHAACHDSGRIADIWLWGCTGTCGPNWGDLAKCKMLCDHIGESCTHLTHFSDGACGIYNQCSTIVNPAEGVNAYVFRKVKIDKIEFKAVRFNVSDRVKVVREVNGTSRNRWQQWGGKPSLEEGEDCVNLFKDQSGTVNSIISKGPQSVAVIFDEDVTKEVWVVSDYLSKEDVLLKEVDDDALVEDVLKNFPRAEDMVAFKCPMTKKIIRVPVVASDGRTYEKSAFVEASNSSELLFENHALNSLLIALTVKVVAREQISSTEELDYQILTRGPPALGAENVASFKCPVSLEFFRDPVVASDGHTYERASIQRVLSGHQVSPITRELLSLDLFPNWAMKLLLSVVIQEASLKKRGGPG